MLSEKIRELRRKSGLSQEELADKLDVSRQAVSKWETGAAVPTTETLVQLADFFGVSLDLLLRGSVPEDPIISPKHSPVRKALGIFLITAAVLAAALMIILQLTGNGGNAAASSAVTLDGNGIIIVASVLCAVGGIAILISSKK